MKDLPPKGLGKTSSFPVSIASLKGRLSWKFDECFTAKKEHHDI